MKLINLNRRESGTTERVLVNVDHIAFIEPAIVGDGPEGCVITAGGHDVYVSESVQQVLDRIHNAPPVTAW